MYEWFLVFLRAKKDMIAEVKCCAKCQSTNLVKNGSNGVGNPKYKCKDCGFGGVINSRRKSEEVKENLLKASQERSSSRGLARIFGVSHQTALNWIKKSPIITINKENFA
jgi:transposase-like protein